MRDSVNIAAILGYEPARALIVHDYPRSPLIRSVAPSSEAVRYSLDPLLVAGPQSESNRAFVVLTAAYFSGRRELEAYARDLLAALSDDQRLQSVDHLEALLKELSRMPAACMAISRTVVKAGAQIGADCSPLLQTQMQKFLGDTKSSGVEADLRRQALLMLSHEKGS